MDLKPIIISQYRASLEMMRQVVFRCPETLWIGVEDNNKFWHIAYHALFYTHLYLAPIEDEFVPWDKHREGYEFMGTYPWPPFEKPEISEPYSKEDVLEYLQYCDLEVEEKISHLDFAGASGFSWISMNKTELQFYNIRHLQQHIGELCERLWVRDQIEIDWVGMRP